MISTAEHKPRTRDQEVERALRDTRRLADRAVRTRDVQLMHLCAEVLAETTAILFATGSVNYADD